MMTILSKLNGIAARIATAIVLAIVLGIVMSVGLSAVSGYYGVGEDSGGKSHVRVMIGRTFFGVVRPERNPMMLSGRIATAVRLVASAPRSDGPRLLADLAEPELRAALDASPPTAAAEHLDENLDRLRQFVQMQLETLSLPIAVSARRLAADDDEVADPERPPRMSDAGAVIEAALPDGRLLSFTLPDYPFDSGKGLFLFLASIVIIGGLVSVWTARRLARPIREFAGAAERLGVDLTAPPLAVRGPWELRATIETVNRMQHRLQRFLEDRTQMLAAISHDLRAPLARLRLRAELVADGEQQHKMFDDLDAMNAMIESTLAFARDESRQEPRTLVDLGVLVGDICEDIADAGSKVTHGGRRGVDVPCRPTLIRRAVANLIDNAVKYGEAARVNIVQEAGHVVIVVDDDGPGIPADEQEKVFAPFYRRETARDPGKAGVGLGLSIARTVAREHGGDVTLRNRDGGGLSALIELPV